MLPRGLLTRTEVALVIHIDPVGNGVELVRAAKIFHNGEQFVLAVEAASSIVAGIFGAIEFGGGNDLQRDALFSGKVHRVIQLSASETGRVCNDRENVPPQDLMDSPSQEAGINPPGKGH